MLPGLGGVIAGDMKLRGNLETPEALVDLTARGVKWQDDLAIENVVIKGNVATGEQIKGNLSVVLRQLKQR